MSRLDDLANKIVKASRYIQDYYKDRADFFGTCEVEYKKHLAACEHKFSNAILSCGFSPDWDLREVELETMQVAIKRLLKMVGHQVDKIESSAKFIMEDVLGAYKSFLHN